MGKILITGANGFLGSEVTKKFLTEGHEVCILIRENSNTKRIEEILNKIQVSTYSTLFNKSLDKEFKADTILHFSWAGVSSSDRDNFSKQLENLNVLDHLLEYSKKINLKKFIGFGSQAEYGNYTTIVDENYKVELVSSYAKVKNLSRFYIESFCESNNIDWSWIRLFSFYGPNEDEHWFIPWLIKTIINEQPIEMTPGNQRYAYMHVKDFSKIIYLFYNSKRNSGIFNLCSEMDYSLKEITEICKNIINPTTCNINFGAKQYRENQQMLLKGNIEKIKNCLSLTSFDEININDGLREIIKKIQYDIERTS